MCGAILSFIFMAVAARSAQAELSSLQLMAWRSVIGFFIVLALLAFSARGFVQIIPTRPDLHIVRNVFHFAGQNLWLYGVMLIPLSQLVALEFTMPIWVALLAPLVLGEALTRRGVFAAVLGFIGVLIVAQPGVAPLNSGHLAAFVSAIAFALNIMFTKKIMRYDSVLCVLFWMTTLQAAMGFLLGLWFGLAWPSLAVLPAVAVVGVAGLTAHLSLTHALALAPASLVAPMEFLRLPLIAVVGMWLYGEALDLLVFVGAAVIFASNLINMRAERGRSPPPPTGPVG